jgi:hypothetical protein
MSFAFERGSGAGAVVRFWIRHMGKLGQLVVGVGVWNEEFSLHEC